MQFICLNLLICLMFLPMIFGYSSYKTYSIQISFSIGKLLVLTVEAAVELRGI